MYRIYENGSVKAICRECRKLHSKASCPLRTRKSKYQISESTRRQREFMSMALAVQEDLRRSRNG